MKQVSVLAAAVLFSIQAHAATVTHTGTVNIIQTYNSDFAEDWISVQGLTTSGHTCTADSGRVVLLIKDDSRGQRMMSIATAALLSGKTVTVNLNDTKKRAGSNYCYLQHIAINP